MGVNVQRTSISCLGAGAIFAALLLLPVACAGTPESADSTTAVQTTTQRTGPPDPATPASAPEIPVPRYTRLAPENFGSGSEPGQVGFATADGRVTCEFRPVEEDPSPDRAPSSDWLLGFAQGSCRHGGPDTYSYVVADTDPQRRPEFAGQQDWLNHLMPTAYHPLRPGTYIDLHTLGCLAASEDSLTCVKYATNEAFQIDPAGSRMLDAPELGALLDTGGLRQILSPVPVFSVDGASRIACFTETPGDGNYWCQMLGPVLWPGEHNLVRIGLDTGEIELLGADPALSFHRARQPVTTGAALVDEKISAHVDGDRVQFRTGTGTAFWVGSGGAGWAD